MNTFMKRALTVLLATMMLFGACAMAADYPLVQLFDEPLTQAKIEEDYGYWWLEIPLNKSNVLELDVSKDASLNGKTLKFEVFQAKDENRNPIPVTNDLFTFVYDEDNSKLKITASKVGRSYICAMIYDAQGNEIGYGNHWEVNAFKVNEPEPVKGNVGTADTDALMTGVVSVVKMANTANAYSEANQTSNIEAEFVSEGFGSATTFENLTKAVAAGETIKTEITIAEAAPESTAAVNAILGELEGGESIATYLDLTIMLTAAGKDLGTLNKLDEPATFTVDLPAAAQQAAQAGQAIYLINYHNGKASRIPATVSADYTKATFTASEFSPYALVYAAPAVSTGDLPKTGDDSSLLLWTAMMMTAVAGALLLMRRKQTN